MATTTVFLEDIQNVATPKSAAPTVYLEDLQVSKKEKKVPVASATTGKRQRTLFDMQFSASGEAKRPRLAPTAARFTASSASSSASASSSTPASAPSAPTRQTLNSLPFSLSAFIASLPEEHQALLALECACLGKSWLKVLAPALRTGAFLALKRFLLEQGVRGAEDSQVGRVFPPARDIYAWSATPLGRVKVVILGQDPYPRAGQAHGFSFSVPKGVAVPASLQNIYKELRAEYPSSTSSDDEADGFTPPRHGTLTPWAQSGVLLLNTVLTVSPNSPNSHAGKGWEGFTEAVLRAVDKWGGANLPSVAGGAGREGVGRGVVVMAWGKQAAARVAWMNTTKHLILTSAHPSPKSADRGFFGNGHFRQANEWLEARYGVGTGVEWGAL
ncbi:uracil-DNA glycosylase-like protein [Mycena galericulata]|nr:uracil-DNA glycosylase-like protein [Mycena galericulata]